MLTVKESLVCYLLDLQRSPWVVQSYYCQGGGATPLVLAAWEYHLVGVTSKTMAASLYPIDLAPPVAESLHGVLLLALVESCRHRGRFAAG